MLFALSQEPSVIHIWLSQDYCLLQAHLFSKRYPSAERRVRAPRTDSRAVAIVQHTDLSIDSLRYPCAVRLNPTGKRISTNSTILQVSCYCHWSSRYTLHRVVSGMAVSNFSAGAGFIVQIYKTSVDMKSRMLKKCRASSMHCGKCSTTSFPRIDLTGLSQHMDAVRSH